MATQRPVRATALSTIALALALAGCARNAPRHAAMEAPPPKRSDPAATSAGPRDQERKDEPSAQDAAREQAARVEIAAKLAEAAQARPAEAQARLAEARSIALESGIAAAQPGLIAGHSNVTKGERDFDTERYAHLEETGFRRAADAPLSTFSIDVDTASYANVRRFLEGGAMPPPGAVRIEELVNYFRYDDPEPRGRDPFSVTTEVAECPWDAANRLVRIGLKGRSIDERDVPPRNLVFLVDVSGSMQSHDKLPWVKAGLSMLADRLRPQDRVALVVYAGAAGVVLEPTSDRSEVLDALDRLEAGGSTNGAQGIQLAYDLARQSFRGGGVNRVILATDGDFNVGVTSLDELVRLIEKERESGVFLTVLGFGTGNLNDQTMEQLADEGNGNFSYVDSLEEAEKILVREAGSTLVTIAKDVKMQVEWNPAEVEAYRLVGYENRMLAAEDFNDDRKDAGEIGAGHSVTALYEVVPRGGRVPGAPSVDPLRYQDAPHLTKAATSGDLMTLKLRWKRPDADASELMEVVVRDGGRMLRESSDDLRFSAAVAAWGMLLRDSEHAGGATWTQVIDMAQGALGDDEHGDRAGFVQLARRTRELAPTQVAVTQ